VIFCFSLLRLWRQVSGALDGGVGDAMTWLGWVVLGFAAVWGVCFALALPVFLVVDTCNNWAHGNKGLSGYIHTLARIPVLVIIAPLYLVLIAGQALGYWQE
jgi:hypothetical protein